MSKKILGMKPATAAIVAGTVVAGGLLASSVASGAPADAAPDPQRTAEAERAGLPEGLAVTERGSVIWTATGKLPPTFNRGTKYYPMQLISRRDLGNGFVQYMAWDPRTRELKIVDSPSNAMRAQLRRQEIEAQAAARAAASGSGSGSGASSSSVQLPASEQGGIGKTLGQIGRWALAFWSGGGSELAFAAADAVKKDDDGTTSGAEVVATGGDAVAAEEAVKNDPIAAAQGAGDSANA